ncbi:MAG: asparagine synthase (glutamine-hydrolyzing) [Bacillota bacterium]
MCAINGITSENRELVTRMNAVTNHRGPDATDVFVDAGITLGHDRLAIIDLSKAARQPMHSADGRYTIVFNGEIYNYRELRTELEGTYAFRTSSDTEVILALYALEGVAALSRLNGIFAFALWDHAQKELLLARDWFGVKPLYYAHTKTGNLIFSSEMKGILESGEVDRTVNQESLAHYFQVLYVPEPNTIFAAIRSIPAGHYATVQGSEFSLHRYESPLVTAVLPRSRQERAVFLKETVERAAVRQLVSDRPVGIYLSGGFDSSSLLASVAGHMSEVRTFSVGFDLGSDEEEGKFNRDFELARRTAAHYGAEHHEVRVGASEMIPYLERALWHLDTPIANSTIIPQMKLAEVTKPHVAVALAGDGGDELFGGYERYRLSVLSDLYQRMTPKGIRQFLSGMDRFQKLNTPPDVSRFELFMFTKETALSRMLAEALPFEKTKHLFVERIAEASQRDFEEVMMDVDQRTWLRDEALLRTDKTGMASGLEVRVPLLDYEVAGVSRALSAHEKVSPFGTKLLFKEAFKGTLPDFLYQEPKRGFFPPAAKWIRRPEVLAQVKEILSPSYCDATVRLFNWNELAGMLDEHVEKRGYHLVPLWTALSFQIWARSFSIRL